MDQNAPRLHSLGPERKLIRKSFIGFDFSKINKAYLIQVITTPQVPPPERASNLELKSEDIEKKAKTLDFYCIY